jgi:hypothetical protein
MEPPNYIEIPSYQQHEYEYHLGQENNYEKWIGSHFEQIENNNSFIQKAIIYDIKYSPDALYVENDGITGTCWCAEILDDSSNNNNIHVFYAFRHFSDLITFYEKKTAFF